MDTVIIESVTQSRDQHLGWCGPTAEVRTFLKVELEPQLQSIFACHKVPHVCGHLVPYVFAFIEDELSRSEAMRILPYNRVYVSQEKLLVIT